jgi:glucosylceramidase
MSPSNKEQLPTVTLQSSERFQTFIGFGGSFTESSAGQDLSEDQKKELAQAYFSKERGLGYRLGRVHMNSCDFSQGNWSCCDTPGDMTLSNFSISRYHDAIIPMVKNAVEAAGEQLLLVASPWSPPSWMKDNGKMCGGGKLKKECRQVWADHYVRFAQEFQKEGLPLWAFTVQNEPKAWMVWESCIYEHDEERDFVRDYLGPALESSKLGLKLIVWDHNRDEMYDRAKACFDDEQTSRHIWGIGFHWYGDPAFEFWPSWPHSKFERDCENVQKVHDAWPSKHIIFTEGCQEKGARIGDWGLGERYAMEIIGQLNMWTEAWIDWNLLLDDSGGPNHVGNLCSAPVIFDTRTRSLIYQSSFYYIGHFSRHIQPGAQRIGCDSGDANLEVVAFANPDGTLVAVVLNRTKSKRSFRLEHLDTCALAEAPGHSITTFTLLA